MIPHDFFYSFINGVYLIFLAPILIWLLLQLSSFRKKCLNNFSPSVLKDILIPRSRISFYSKIFAFTIVWTFATLALMQPKGNGRYPFEKQEAKVGVSRKVHDVILMIDASASMEVTDTRTGARRLDFAKEIADELVSQTEGENVALYAFTSDTSKLSPPTMDYFFVRLMLRDLGINEGAVAGTDFSKALSVIDTNPQKTETFVIISDGGDTELETFQGNEREKRLRTFLNLIGSKQIFTIGVGSKEGAKVPDAPEHISKLDEDLLKQIALNGKYYFANDWTAMDLAKDLTKQIRDVKTSLEEVAKTPSRGSEDLVYDLYFQYPLFIALIFLIWILYFPDTRVRL